MRLDRTSLHGGPAALARRSASFAPSAMLALLLLASCGSDKKSPAAPIVGVVPDFSLTDVNPNSATSGQAVSPRQHRGAISAWYFGTAT